MMHNVGRRESTPWSSSVIMLLVPTIQTQNYSQSPSTSSGSFPIRGFRSSLMLIQTDSYGPPIQMCQFTIVDVVYDDAADDVFSKVLTTIYVHRSDRIEQMLYQLRCHFWREGEVESHSDVDGDGDEVTILFNGA